MSMQILPFPVILLFLFYSIKIYSVNNVLPGIGVLPKKQNIVAIANSESVVEVIEGDDTEKAGLEIGIVQTPVFGKVRINPDNSISYIPNDNVCEELDFFEYYIAGESGYETATVHIEILCEPLTIFSGLFIQDGDLPAKFKILGVENYPNNQLSIFDQLGMEIYSKKGYRNEWDGNINGQPLIPGIYYYVFSDGKGKTHTGYLEINEEN